MTCGVWHQLDRYTYHLKNRKQNLADRTQIMAPFPSSFSYQISLQEYNLLIILLHLIVPVKLYQLSVQLILCVPYSLLDELPVLILLPRIPTLYQCSVYS